MASSVFVVLTPAHWHIETLRKGNFAAQIPYKHVLGLACCYMQASMLSNPTEEQCR